MAPVPGAGAGWHCRQDGRPACRSIGSSTINDVAAGRTRRASRSPRSSNADASAARRHWPIRTRRTIDWATAEELALATILADGIPIRLTGEDVERGTFSHRHAVYHDADERQGCSCRCRTFAQARAPFEIYNSPLSENGAIGFEFGYNIQEPDRLVIWEAQYGDFINGAQVMLDQFVTSGRAKWGLQPSLVFLLPHGYEGQGPEHSSARPERIPPGGREHQPAARQLHDGRAVLPPAPAAGRAARRDPLPLVRAHAEEPAAPSGRGLRRRASSSRAASSRSSTMRTRAGGRRASSGCVLCSGKVYVDLISHEGRAPPREVAICRVEQLYPFPNVALGRSARRLPVAARSGLAAGRAREHGRLGVRAAAARGTGRATAARCATSAARAARARPKALRPGTRSIRRCSSTTFDFRSPPARMKHPTRSL